MGRGDKLLRGRAKKQEQIEGQHCPADAADGHKGGDAHAGEDEEAQRDEGGRGANKPGGDAPARPVTKHEVEGADGYAKAKAKGEDAEIGLGDGRDDGGEGDGVEILLRDEFLRDVVGDGLVKGHAPLGVPDDLLAVKRGVAYLVFDVGAVLGIKREVLGKVDLVIEPIVGGALPGVGGHVNRLRGFREGGVRDEVVEDGVADFDGREQIRVPVGVIAPDFVEPGKRGEVDGVGFVASYVQMEDGLLLPIGGVVVDVSGIGHPKADHRPQPSQDEEGREDADIPFAFGEIVGGEGAIVGLLLLLKQIGELLLIDVQLPGEGDLHMGIGAQKISGDAGVDEVGQGGEEAAEDQDDAGLRGQIAGEEVDEDADDYRDDPGVDYRPEGLLKRLLGRLLHRPSLIQLVFYPRADEQAPEKREDGDEGEGKEGRDVELAPEGHEGRKGRENR